MTSGLRLLTASSDLGDGTGLSLPSPGVDPRLAGAIRLADVLADGAMLPFEPVELGGDDILFFQYTGGTTGLSKGAVLSHRNLVANTEQFKAFLPQATAPGEDAEGLLARFVAAGVTAADVAAVGEVCEIFGGRVVGVSTLRGAWPWPDELAPAVVCAGAARK